MMIRAGVSRVAAMALATLAGALFTSNCARAEESGGAKSYVLLDEQSSQLKVDFNKAKGSVRLVFIIDPTCTGCLRGLDGVDDALLSVTNDPRLQTFIVHVPVLAPTLEAKDISLATKLTSNAHVRHYFNPSGKFGDAVTAVAGLERDGHSVFAWDVWLIYGPDAVWEGALPPKPRRLMHQLRALQGNKSYPHLDADAFANEARQLLTGIPK